VELGPCALSRGDPTQFDLLLKTEEATWNFNAAPSPPKTCLICKHAEFDDVPARESVKKKT
jgi:hypothetical protein